LEFVGEQTAEQMMTDIAKAINKLADGTAAPPVWLDREDPEYLAYRDESLIVHVGSAHPRKARAIRCIFGNPLRYARLDPSWLTPLVSGLARAAFEAVGPLGSLEADRVAVLADALEDAGGGR
jgi:hypothetical protein